MDYEEKEGEFDIEDEDKEVEETKGWSSDFNLCCVRATRVT